MQVMQAENQSHTIANISAHQIKTAKKHMLVQHSKYHAHITNTTNIIIIIITLSN